MSVQWPAGGRGLLLARVALVAMFAGLVYATVATRLGFTLADVALGVGVLSSALRSPRVTWWALYGALVVAGSAAADPTHRGGVLVVGALAGVLLHRHVRAQARRAA